MCRWACCNNGYSSLVNRTVKQQFNLTLYCLYWILVSLSLTVSMERWCRLRGNLLFYFKSRDHWAEPAGLLVLEHCTVTVDPASQLAFIIGEATIRLLLLYAVLIYWLNVICIAQEFSACSCSAKFLPFWFILVTIRYGDRSSTTKCARRLATVNCELSTIHSYSK